MKEVTKEMKEFIEDLQVFACNWIDSVQQVIVDHLDELFKDESVRYLVKKHRQNVEKNKEISSRTLLNAYESGNPVSTYHFETYSEVLYELCYNRFKNE